MPSMPLVLRLVLVTMTKVPTGADVGTDYSFSPSDMALANHRVRQRQVAHKLGLTFIVDTAHWRHPTVRIDFFGPTCSDRLCSLSEELPVRIKKKTIVYSFQD